MAISFTAATTHTKTLTNPSTGSEDKVYGVDYVSASSHTTSVAVAGATAARIPYASSATELTDSANLTYSETSGPRWQVGSGSTTSSGWVQGYGGASGHAAIWHTYYSASPSLTNATLLDDGSGGNTYLQGGVSVFIKANGVTKFGQTFTAGRGPDITMGTATTDVGLRATQAVNASGVLFKSFKYSVTYTASAAGTLHSEWNGGAAGTTQLMALTKEGALSHVGIAFGSLPTGVAGMVAYVTDSNTATWGATIAAGGANKVLAFYNGTNWTVAGA